MATADSTAPVQAEGRAGLRTALLVASAALVALVAIQAVLAGQALFGTADIVVHGYVGNASFTVGVLAVVFAALARVPRFVLALTVLVVLALFVQTGLGYAGRQSTAAAAWHVPLGVITFGLVCAQLTGVLLVGLGRRHRSSPTSTVTAA